MERNLALIGFGEAAMAFAPSLRATLRAYDIKTARPELANAKQADYATYGAKGCDTPGAALASAHAALSLVTADQALAAAESAEIVPGLLWFDMNSVAPETKRTGAAAVEAKGGRYVDVAIMSPVHPAGTGVPLLVSGPHAADSAPFLREIGFGKVRVVEGPVGRASSIKMIRSVIVKGIEALTAECVVAASTAGVLVEVLASLDAGPPLSDWTGRADYNLDRMMVHGLRRAAEMEEVVKMLDALGTDSAMTRRTVERQRAIGALSLSPPAGLSAKLALLHRELRPA